ncbi:MAG: metal ABC transporter permease, partial [Clostridia bacterium]|nr:metal ABC transporter permease [Clostridia bacterium]
VGFGAMSIALALNIAPLYVAIPATVISAFLLLKASENSRLGGDSAIALISTTSVAIGVMIVSMTKGMTTDISNYMFGSILVMTKADVVLSIVLSLLVLVLFILFYNRIFAITFDESFAKATGTNTNLFNSFIAILTAITIVLGMRMMGAMLISSLIIFPALSSLKVCKSFGAVIVLSAVISAISFICGLFMSFTLDSPTGATVVVSNLVVYLLFCLIAKIRKN